MMDPKTQRPKGFGFVSYESAIDAQKAMKAMNGRVIIIMSFAYIYCSDCVCNKTEYINLHMLFPGQVISFAS